MQLSQESIIAASLEILNKYGLADMSMRRLALSLGVAPGALYWHFKNKQALIDATARALLDDFFQLSDISIKEAIFTFRNILLSYRDGGELISAALADSVLHEEVIETLISLDDTLSYAQSANLIHLTLGSTVMEQTQQQRAEYIGDTPTHSWDALFAQGVDMLLSPPV
ncbi:TetR-family transcription regulator [Corynebacterium kutscheri]|uniref:TetR-family transcription regulator n=1 Tax=Corynebacterium kutscheri TaxID=35755 RepID=A0A0F6TDU2_9CORY|nr:TetR family transcriptional regulator [Corynebacterium kutscheri]AKE41526.1 transcriptional regulator, TetR family [Corynebacterium kutscheri]VEH08804.1 TetR-family transcription regulator [Corynebacterium kutscheri]VEH09850.1 TetR-family transcription regulator [Corynebacterium kutscheri]VEH79933.1 TetR-family transcription regulator [Corynebacterium kutscheri]